MAWGLPPVNEKELWFIVDNALKDAKDQVNRDYPTLEALRRLGTVKRAAINDSILRERLPVFPLEQVRLFEQPDSKWSTYIKNEDGTFSYNPNALFNLDKASRNMRLRLPFHENTDYNDSTEIGKERWGYDPLGAHGNAKFIKLGDGRYLMEDTYDLQPFKNIKWLPSDIQNTEVLEYFGGKPFKNRTIFDLKHDWNK